MSRKTTATYAPCAVCQTPFKTTPSLRAKGTQRYCSRACYATDRPDLAIPLADRFWKHVQKTESCWLWTAFKDRNGYGRVSAGPGLGTVLAHRAAWELTNGPIPEGMYLLHNCPGVDNPSCCNPAHLTVGSQADNMQDCSRKGRTTYGERSTGAKLTDITATEIRARYATGQCSQASLAKEYGVCQASISELIRGLTWKHLLPPD